MSLFKMKYDAHRFVNYIFYFIVFGFGFLVGLGVRYGNIDKLFNNILFIDTVEAYEIKDGSITYDEEYIYNLLSNQYEDFSLDKFPYIIVDVGKRNHNISIFALSEEAYNSSIFKSITSTSFTISIDNNLNADFIHNVYTPSSSTFRYSYTSSSNNALNRNKITVSNTFYTNDSYHPSASNFDIPGGSSSLNTNFNKYDFSEYQKPKELVFNDSLFDNNDNFKKVCVNNFDTFSITSNHIQDYDDNNNPLYHSSDFIWFKNGVKGLSTWLYDSETETRVTLFDNNDNSYLDSPYGWYFWFNSIEEIDKYWNSPNSPGIELVSSGYSYSDRYNYYNYTAYPFQMTFSPSYHKYQVFWFRKPTIEYIDITYDSTALSSIGAGASGIRFNENDVIYENSDKFCFYIKKEYDVNILTKNANGDFDSNINVLGGITFNDSTYENSLTNNLDGLLSQVTNFLSRIKGTVDFINSNIYSLYLSFPDLLRMFIFTFLVLLVIKVIIKVVL